MTGRSTSTPTGPVYNLSPEEMSRIEKGRRLRDRIARETEALRTRLQRPLMLEEIAALRKRLEAEEA